MRLSFLRAPRVETLRSRPVRTGTGRDIGVYEYGDPNGRPLFALHGTPSCGAGFDWTDAPARERGLRVIAPDRPGIGHSDAVPMTSVADYSAELGALADALAIDRFLLLGYSGGGPYALAVAHRLAHRVESATIVSGAGEIGAWATWKDLARSDRQLTWAVAARARRSRRSRCGSPISGPRFAPRIALWSAETEMSKSDRQVMRHLGSTEALALFTQALTGSAAGVVARLRAAGAAVERAARRDLGAGALLARHRRHVRAARAHRALIERIPGARLTTWPGEGHLALITHVAEVLDDIAAPTPSTVGSHGRAAAPRSRRDSSRVSGARRRATPRPRR